MAVVGIPKGWWDILSRGGMGTPGRPTTVLKAVTDILMELKGCWDNLREVSTGILQMAMRVQKAWTGIRRGLKGR